MTTAPTTDTKPQAPPRAAQSKVPGSYAGEKIIVGSKLPMALELQHCSSRTEERRDRSTTWKETVSFKVGPVVTIAGTGFPIFPNGEVPEGVERPLVVGGYALTFGVDREFFEKWLAQNEETDLVRNNIIIAHTKQDSIKSIAREHKAVDSGLGPIQRKVVDGETIIADRRVPKKARTSQLQKFNRGEVDADAA